MSVLGGSGSDDIKSNAGSGGRVVLNNVIINDTQINSSGGCSNNEAISSYNGAAGSIYYFDKSRLLLKHSKKCVTTMNTVVNSKRLETVQYFEAVSQAAFTFEIDKGATALDVSFKELIIDELAMLQSPIGNPNFGYISITVDTFYLKNGTISNPSIHFRILADE
jgi:Tfp pilus tip-associated adhesin PilY1